MKVIATVLITLISFSFSYGRQKTAQQVHEKAVAYHDPNGEWNSFAYRLFFEQELPGGLQVKR